MTGAPNVEYWACADSHQHVIGQDIVKGLVHIAGNVDSLRKEVAESNDSAVASALCGVNAQVRSMVDRMDVHRIAEDGRPQRLLEG